MNQECVERMVVVYEIHGLDFAQVTAFSRR